MNTISTNNTGDSFVELLDKEPETLKLLENKDNIKKTKQLSIKILSSLEIEREKQTSNFIKRKFSLTQNEVVEFKEIICNEHMVGATGFMNGLVQQANLLSLLRHINKTSRLIGKTNEQEN